MKAKFDISQMVETTVNSILADSARLYAEYGGSAELIFWGKAAVVFIVFAFLLWCASHLLFS